MKVEETLNAKKYLEILDENLENSIGNMGMDIENPPVIIQDNDPKHNAKLVKKFFTDNDKLFK